MRYSWDLSQCLCISSLSFLAVARLMPNGFSTISRARAAPPLFSPSSAIAALIAA